LKVYSCTVGQEIPALMEHEGQLPYLQKPRNGPHPETVESIPQTFTLQMYFISLFAELLYVM